MPSKIPGLFLSNIASGAST